MVTTPKKLGFDVCQFCGKEFDREETLAIHIQYEHLDEITSGKDE